MGISELLFGSDVEAAVIKSTDTNKIPTLIPPALLFHTKEFSILKEVWDRSNNKQVPHHIFLKLPEGGSWYQDSALIETDFTPSASPEQFFKKYCLSVEHLENFLRPKGYKVWLAPLARFDAASLKELDREDIYQASIAGCNPDLDAIDPAYDCTTVSLEDWEFRGIGGHLHMSISKDYGDILHENQMLLVKLLAITVGNVGTATTDNPQLEALRKEVFGYPGRYRAKTYPGEKLGIEYRSLSGSWLRSLDIVEQVFKAAKFALTLVLEDVEIGQDLVDAYLSRSIQASLAIDVDEANSILAILELN